MVLSVVYPPKGSSIPSAVDIVAVHGLNGDALATWTHPSSGACWLTDFLPQQIPDARVLAFGYNAAVAFGQSTSGVIDHAKSLLSSLIDKRDAVEEQERPLIFIAHSLGGIVVKQALLQAGLEPRYQSIRDATLGILFFGTPHRGSDKATYGKVLSNVAQKVSRRPPSQLLKTLQTNSDVLLRVTSDFRFQIHAYDVISFYEQRPMRIFSSLVVDKHSALLEVEHEEQVPVDADHSMMCKFDHKDNDTYEKVYKRIQRIRSKPRTNTKGDTEPYNKHFYAPRLLSSLFTGHEAICRHLETALVFEHVSEARLLIQKRYVLYGLGGSGKTQICLRYIQIYRERYWAVFWIDASTLDSVQQAIAQIASVLQVEPNVDSVKKALTNAPGRWLLIFDNADNPDLGLAPYFPLGDRGHIIITSRNPECQAYHTVGHHRVGSMLPGDAITLLLTTIGTSASEGSEQMTHNDAQRVVENLGFLALAVAQAGAYIRGAACSAHEYLELYQQRRRVVLEHLPTHNTTDYRYTVFTTWQVSLDWIEALQDTTSVFALRLLRLLCFYHHDRVPLDMFERAWTNSRQDDTTAAESTIWPDVTSDVFDLRQLVHASMTLLVSFSLVERDAGASLSLHPLVREWCQSRLDEQERRSSCQQAISLIAASAAGEDTGEIHIYWHSLASHILACLRVYNTLHDQLDRECTTHWSTLVTVLATNGFQQDALQLSEQVMRLHKSKLGNKHPVTISSMHDLARYYGEAGRYSEALQLVEQALQLRKAEMGDDHPDTLESMQALALCYDDVGRHIEALQTLEQVVQLRKSKLGDDHLDTLNSIKSMHSLAVDCGEVWWYNKALQLMEQVVQLRQTKLGDDHPDTLESMKSLAQCYSDVERYDDALRLARQVVQLYTNKLGEDDPATLKSRLSLSIRYLEASRYNEAIQLSKQILQLRKSKLGDSHPDTIQAMHDLAGHYNKAERYDEALQLAEQVVQSQKSKLGDNHPDTVQSMHNLVVHYNKAKRFDKAIELSQQAFQLQRTKLGDDHPQTIYSMDHLSINYSEAGRHEDAIQLSKQVVQLHKSRLDDGHPDMIRSMDFLATRYSMAERHDEAIQLSQQVLQILKTKLGKDHPDTINSMYDLMMFYREAKRYDEAVQLTERAVQLTKAKVGEEHPDTFAWQDHLAARYKEAKRQDEGILLAEQVMQSYQSKLGSDDASTVQAMCELATDYYEAGRYEEATQLTEQVVQLRKNKLGEDHPDTIDAMHYLAVRYSKIERYKEAVQLAEQVVQLSKRKLGEHHSDTIFSMYYLAFQYNEEERYDEAMQLVEEVVQLQKQKLGEDHPQTIDSLEFLADVVSRKAAKETWRHKLLTRLRLDRFASHGYGMKS